MRNLTFTLSFLLLSITGFSQEHWGLPPEGSIYTNAIVSVSAFGDVTNLRVEDTWLGEVEQDGYTWREYLVPDPYGDTTTTSYFIREENGQWILKNTEWPNQELDEFLLYDWSASVGDTLQSASAYQLYDGPFELRVDSIQEQEFLDGSIRKVFHLTNLDIETSFPLIWIEGIGPMDGVMLNAGGSSLVDAGEVLICAHLGNTHVYESDYIQYLVNYENCMWDPVGVAEIDHSQIEIFPNPVDDIISVRKVNGNFGKASRIEIADLHCRIVLSEELAGGKGIIELDLSSIDSGIYLLRMTTENGKTLTEKIVVN